MFIVQQPAFYREAFMDPQQMFEMFSQNKHSMFSAFKSQ